MLIFVTLKLPHRLLSVAIRRSSARIGKVTAACAAITSSAWLASNNFGHNTSNLYFTDD